MPYRKGGWNRWGLEKSQNPIIGGWNEQGCRRMTKSYRIGNAFFSETYINAVLSSPQKETLLNHATHVISVFIVNFSLACQSISYKNGLG